MGLDRGWYFASTLHVAERVAPGEIRAACMVGRDKSPCGEKDQPASAMDQSLHSYMRLGLVQGVAFPASGDDPEAFLHGVEQIATDDFFATIEVRGVPDDGLQRRVGGVTRARPPRRVYPAAPPPGAP